MQALAHYANPMHITLQGLPSICYQRKHTIQTTTVPRVKLIIVRLKTFVGIKGRTMSINALRFYCALL